MMNKTWIVVYKIITTGCFIRFLYTRHGSDSLTQGVVSLHELQLWHTIVWQTMNYLYDSIFYPISYTRQYSESLTWCVVSLHERWE